MIAMVNQIISQVSTEGLTYYPPRFPKIKLHFQVSTSQLKHPSTPLFKTVLFHPQRPRSSPLLPSILFRFLYVRVARFPAWKIVQMEEGRESEGPVLTWTL